MIGLCVLAVMTAAAVGAPRLAPYPPDEIHPDARLAGPSARFWLGTDQLGRDTFSRVVWGARASLAVTGPAGLLILLIGWPLGLVSGYAGGWLDACLSRLMEAVLILPTFFLILAAAAVLGSAPAALVLVLGGSLWPAVARLARAEALRWRGQEFVLAARALGASPGLILWRHLTPNSAPAVLTGWALTLGEAVLAEAGLSYVGLGDPNWPTWGRLLSEARPYFRDAGGLAIWPGLALTALLLAFHLLAEAGQPQD